MRAAAPTVSLRALCEGYVSAPVLGFPGERTSKHSFSPAAAILGHHNWIRSESGVDDERHGGLAVLDIYAMHRPHALKRELTDVFAAAAAVCIHRFHVPPKVWAVKADDGDTIHYEVPWTPPSDEGLRTYDDDDETTEFGACGMALAAVDIHMGLAAYSRAKKKTGVDFYLCTARASDTASSLSYDLDHRETVGLEVSGVSDDTDANFNERVRRKLAQVRSGRSPDRAIAGVVGFRGARVVFRTAKP